jgi:hypothetical protein
MLVRKKKDKELNHLKIYAGKGKKKDKELNWSKPHASK